MYGKVTLGLGFLILPIFGKVGIDYRFCCCIIGLFGDLSVVERQDFVIKVMSFPLFY